MLKKPSPALMAALRDFAFRHDIFVEAREFDDGFLFTRLPRRGSKRVGQRRHFEVFLRCNESRVKFYSVTCGSEDLERSQFVVDFPEKVLLMPAEAAIQYEKCGRRAKRWATHFPEDPDTARALFAYVRSESQLLVKLLGDTGYKELLRLVRRHGRKTRPQDAQRRSSVQRRRRS